MEAKTTYFNLITRKQCYFSYQIITFFGILIRNVQEEKNESILCNDTRQSITPSMKQEINNK